MFEIEIVEETLNQELVKTVNARDLHAGLDVGNNFSTWVKNRIEKYGFAQDTDFTVIKSTPANGGVAIDYHITLDMAKELSMVEKTDKGKEARQYFIKMEKQVMTQLSVPVESDQLALAKINLEMLKLTEKTKQLAIEAKVKLGKKKTNIRRVPNCPSNFVTMKAFERSLEDAGEPIPLSFLTSILRYYATSIDTRANCIHEEQFNELLDNVFADLVEDGSYMKDKESGNRVATRKIDWYDF
jgi:phage anti-repressor protein